MNARHVVALAGAATGLWLFATQHAEAAKVRRSEREICEMTDVAFVGSVVGLVDFTTFQTGRAPGASSSAQGASNTERVVLTPEIIAFGSAGAEVGIRVGIGWHGGRKVYASDDVPEVGDRYAVVGRWISEVGGRSQVDVVPLLWRKLDPQGVLPPAQLARSIWSEHCAPGYDPKTQGAPTAPFVSLLDWELLSICEHY